MKITVISFDFWNYDAHIVDELKKQGVQANHINIGAYKHKNFGARLHNTFSKIFLKKNLKTEKRNELIIESLKKNGKQDQILVINPELIDAKTHEVIRTFTDRYVAYLYDSLARCPAQHLFRFFDKVFSFDKNDAETHGFELITNYNYFADYPLITKTEYDLVYLASYDNRMLKAIEIAKKVRNFGKKPQFFVTGKKSWKKKISNPDKEFMTFRRKRIQHEEIPALYGNSKVILDLVRENQDGLSFRVFEAMALHKKLITNNKTINDYDFYNPKNILLINDDLSNLQKDFFETEYEELPQEVYEKYTLRNWVKTIFDLN